MFSKQPFRFTGKQVLKVFIHLLVWFFILFFLNGNLFVWIWAPFESSKGTLLIPTLYGGMFNALVFYANVLYLYPRKLQKRLLGGYSLWVFLLLLSTSTVEGVIDYHYAASMGLLIEEYAALTPTVFVINNSLIHVIYWLVSFIYIKLEASEKKEVWRKTMERELLDTELKYLKAQINPHFLFNGINSVYHLIDDRPAQAKETLLTFSELLRYQLYECNELFIPLTKELTYLTNYLALEEVRKGDDATVRWEVQNYDEEAKIAPMLLQPFIENAFKHLSHHNNPAQNCLDVSLTVDQQMLSLKVENTTKVTEKSGTRVTESKGVGLENVKRRLNLIYPKRHQLLISQPPGRFQVHIMITLQHE